MNHSPPSIEIVLSPSSKNILREWQKKSHETASRHGGGELILPDEQILLDKISLADDLLLLSERHLTILYNWMLNAVKNKYGGLTFVFPGEEKLFKLISRLAEVHLGEQVTSHSGGVGHLMKVKDPEDTSGGMNRKSKLGVSLILIVIVLLVGALFLWKDKQPADVRSSKPDSLQNQSPDSNNQRPMNPQRSRRVLDSVYQSKQGAVQEIYRESKKEQKGLSGVLTLNLSINQQGKVEFYRAVEVTLSNYEFLETLYQQIETWEFPAVDEPGIQIAPFTFKFD